MKLQAQVGETDSKKAKRAIEAENKKKGIITPQSKKNNRNHHKKKQDDSSDDDSEEEEEEVVNEELSEAAKEAAEKLLKLKEIKISQKIVSWRIDRWSIGKRVSFWSMPLSLFSIADLKSEDLFHFCILASCQEGDQEGVREGQEL